MHTDTQVLVKNMLLGTIMVFTQLGKDNVYTLILNHKKI